ncbi:MAG: TIGR03435 family protein [Vicinamibacteraceae bacterium]|nr:TIGR03435 family protein [Vicinamibacteraceae bacterium]
MDRLSPGVDVRLWVRLSLLVCGLSLGTQPVVSAQSRGPTWNAPAPELSLSLLDGPPGEQARLAALRGRAVVLEFWATWCSGCIELIPHINELTEQFKDAPVQFISVTDEDDRNVVRAFLERRPIRGWVALDERGETFNRYGIVGRPYAALIDADGILRAVIPSSTLDAAMVRQLVSGSLALEPPAEIDTPIIGTEAGGPMPLLQAIVRPAMAAEDVGMSPGGTRLVGNRWETWGVDLRRLLSTAYMVPESRIQVPDSLAKTRFDVSMLLPDGREERRLGMLRQVIHAAFGVAVRRETREIPVMVLRMAADGPMFATLPKGQDISRVVRFSEIALKTVVVDETGLAGTYDYVLTFPRSEQHLREAVAALGLTLTPGRRAVELLVAERVGPQ